MISGCDANLALPYKTGTLPVAIMVGRSNLQKEMIGDMRSRIIVAGLALCFLVPLIGCTNDPYSAKRIRMRGEHYSQLSADVEKRESSGYKRMEEAKITLDKWWLRDCERFNRIAPTAGDYFW